MWRAFQRQTRRRNTRAVGRKTSKRSRAHGHGTVANKCTPKKGRARLSDQIVETTAITGYGASPGSDTSQDHPQIPRTRLFYRTRRNSATQFGHPANSVLMNLARLAA